MPTAHSFVAKPSTTNRAKISNDPRYVAGHTGRSPAGRRRRDLVNFFATALGGLDKVSPVQITDIRRAAELTALAEETRAKALCEGTGAIDLTALVRLEGAASRAVRSLGIKSGPQAPAVSLAEYLATTTFQVPEAGDDAEHELETDDQTAVGPESTPVP
jgi:hypothetical protein